ncbi:adenylosuccinate lyase [Lutibacter sp.]|uniref:adenylosuccinate lyase n=1 Tax=Lutibacter sp. TaxID=1925666 RepID=UPI003565C066
MTKEFLITQLENIENAKRKNRDRVATIVLKNNELFPFLLKITFDVNNKISIKAAWILELVCEQQLDFIVPHLPYFVENISLVKFESAIRPLSKICNFIAIAYNSKTDNLIKSTLLKSEINTIIEASFDWMIGNHKVAAKAYAMNTLYIFGKNIDWVHPELKLLIEQNMAIQSAAYKARGRMTLALINKK